SDLDSLRSWRYSKIHVIFSTTCCQLRISTSCKVQIFCATPEAVNQNLLPKKLWETCSLLRFHLETLACLIARQKFMNQSKFHVNFSTKCRLPKARTPSRVQIFCAHLPEAVNLNLCPRNSWETCLRPKFLLLSFPLEAAV